MSVDSQAAAALRVSEPVAPDTELAKSTNQQLNKQSNSFPQSNPQHSRSSNSFGIILPDQHSPSATDRPPATHGPLVSRNRDEAAQSHPKFTIPASISHVAEDIQDELHHVTHLTHDYIIAHYRGITTLLVAVCRVLEQTDATLLPAVYFYVGCSFNATPTQLGSITFTRLVVSALASPFGGLLGHRYNRVLLVACSCWYWSLCTSLFAASSSTTQGMMIWALNGIGLGVMIPNAQSLVADYYDATHRGRAFGMLLAVGNLGSMLSSAYATNIGGLSILGIQGWRFAFLTVAVISAAAGAAMWFAARDPRCSQHTWQLDQLYRQHSSSDSSSSSSSSAAEVAASSEQLVSDVVAAAAPAGSKDQQQLRVRPAKHAPPAAAAVDEEVVIVKEAESSSTGSTAVTGLLSGVPSAAAAAAAAAVESDEQGSKLGTRINKLLHSATAKEMWEVLSTPSFIVVVIQGFLGSMPWSAFAFTTLYLQLQGWSDVGASVVMAVFLGADAVGAFVGGVVGDWAAARYPDHGRITACQFSVGIGVPLCLLIFQGLPLGATWSVFVTYIMLFTITGLLISWAATACNNPIFAEIVPPQLRTLVYAFDRCLEGVLSAAGAPLVGVSAQRLFHFSGAAATQDCSSGARITHHQPDLSKARALGDALTLFSTFPWTLCCLVYTLLHWTYPRDKRKGSCTGMPLESVQFSRLPREDHDLDRDAAAAAAAAGSRGDHDESVGGPTGFIDRIDQYISNPRGGDHHDHHDDVGEVELQETGLLIHR